MKHLLTLLASLAVCPLFAVETLDKVDFKFPQSGEWEVFNKMEHDKGTTIIYVPKGSSKENVKEFFGMNRNVLPFDPSAPEALKSSLAQLFPGKQVDVKILHQDDKSLTFEFTVADNGKNIVYGISRAFSTADGSLVLEYQTSDAADIEKIRSTWLPTLKEAKVKN